MTLFAPVDLSPVLNARAATSNGDRDQGAVNAWGNSFPEEEIPFGDSIRIGDFCFHLARPDAQGNDHLELRDQSLPVPSVPLSGIALLCCGEMGPRRFTVRLEGAGGSHETALVAPAWTIGQQEQPAAPHLAATHLHYPGGYELSHLRPVFWAIHAPVPRLRGDRLALRGSPLVHILAISLLVEAQHG